MGQIPDILQRILAHKAAEIVQRSQRINIRSLSRRVEAAPTPRGFYATIETQLSTGRAAVIAEIKKASPSAGVLREDFNPPAIARSYERAGATCLSVLTDERFFQGADDFLRQAREACALPVLRKDFVIDPYQLYEARLLGADCVLLIVGALGDALLRELLVLVLELGMDALVEVHDEVELDRALALPARLIGINNRSLRTFETDLETTLRLRERIPSDRILVTESGIRTLQDVGRLRDHGVHVFLVGEAFMRAADPGQRLRALFP
jgi:indole-3-glycerol phosphate synthase